MKAMQCAWHASCRHQQSLARSEEEAGVRRDWVCWAEVVECGDGADDMDDRCPLFWPKRRFHSIPVSPERKGSEP